MAWLRGAGNMQQGSAGFPNVSRAAGKHSRTSESLELQLGERGDQFIEVVDHRVGTQLTWSSIAEPEADRYRR